MRNISISTKIKQGKKKIIKILAQKITTRCVSKVIWKIGSRLLISWWKGCFLEGTSGQNRKINFPPCVRIQAARLSTPRCFLWKRLDHGIVVDLLLFDTFQVLLHLSTFTAILCGWRCRQSMVERTSWFFNDRECFG